MTFYLRHVLMFPILLLPVDYDYILSILLSDYPIFVLLVALPAKKSENLSESNCPFSSLCSVWLFVCHFFKQVFPEHLIQMICNFIIAGK